MKKMMLLLVLAAVVAGCGNKKETTISIVVASGQRDCVGVAPQKCLLIKREGSSDWEFWYSGIEGFTYEPGYEYELEIRPESVSNLPAGHSSLKYVLVKEKSKIKKVSEGMPLGISTVGTEEGFTN